MPSILAASTPHRIAAALLATTFAITFMIAGGASAQPSEPAPSGCGTSYISQAPSSPPLSPVRYDGVLEAGQIAITSIGHSSFVIQSSGGALIATDYGSWRPEGYAPDVVTMDVAHVGHHDFSPPAVIKTVLMSWTPESGPMRHDLSFKDTHIRNVSTDVVVGPNLIEKGANSIFVFEIGDLCIAHLGHLYGEPTDGQYREIGQIDILFAPIDGPYILDAQRMLGVAERMGARVVIPMHYFVDGSLARFIATFGVKYRPREADGPIQLFSRSTLPSEPTLLILPEL